MGALLQLIGEPPDDQIATEAHRRSGVMQCPPGTPQLRCRPINQPRNLVIKLGQVRVLQSVFPTTVWTEIGRRLARVLASRSIVELGFHRLAGLAMSGAACNSSFDATAISPSLTVAGALRHSVIPSLPIM